MSEEEWNMARGIPVLGLGIDKHSPEQIKKQKQRAKRFIFLKIVTLKNHIFTDSILRL